MAALVWFTVGQYGARSLAFGSAIAYMVLSLWGFLYVREDLPPGMLPRLFLTLIFIVCLTIACVVLPSSRRAIAAAPVALLTGFLTLQLFVDRSVRQNLFSRVRSQLRHGSARSSAEGRRTPEHL